MSDGLIELRLHPRPSAEGVHHASGASDEWRGTIIAHELGHLLGRTNRAGQPDGNLMFRSVNPHRRPAQELSPVQIDMSRTRARRILEQVRRLAG